MGDKQCAYCGHITTGFEHQEWEAAQHATECLKAEIARLRTALAIADRFLIGNINDKFYGDWACKECHPHSDMLKDGFVCAYHAAVARTALSAKEPQS